MNQWDEILQKADEIREERKEAHTVVKEKRLQELQEAALIADLELDKRRKQYKNRNRGN